MGNEKLSRLQQFTGDQVSIESARVQCRKAVTAFSQAKLHFRSAVQHSEAAVAAMNSDSEGDDQQD